MSEEVPRTEAANVGFPADAKLTPWPEARQALVQATTYWVGTVRRDGRPHVAPVWCVWLEGLLVFSTGERSVKGRNLALDPRCTVNLEANGLHVVVEGSANRVGDETLLQRMTELYGPKYDWPLQVGDGIVHDGQGNGGPAFAVTPSRVLAFRTGDEPFSATRFVFSAGG